MASALKTTGLAPHRLELEIVETLLLDNTEATMATLRRAQGHGRIDRDGRFRHRLFEPSYLWKFPFDKIKIDRSFMESFEKSGRDVETVVKTIIALGREMHMRVTVEGVETSRQVDFRTMRTPTRCKASISANQCLPPKSARTFSRHSGRRPSANPPKPNCAGLETAANRKRNLVIPSDT